MEWIDAQKKNVREFEVRNRYQKLTIIVCSLTILVLSCLSLCSADHREDWLIIPGVRVGKIVSTSSEKELLKNYAKNDIKVKQVDVGEAYLEQGVIIYPNEPQKKLELVWKDKKNRKFPD